MRLSRTSLTLALAAVPALVAQESAPDPAPRPQLAYQGRLLEAGQPVTGTRTFTFILLDPQGAELWNSGPLQIGVNNGLYAVVLGGGDQPAIPIGVLPHAGLKLRMVLGTQPMSPDVDLVPALQARSAFEFSGPLAGDATGTQNATRVIRLQGIPLDAANPSIGQGLVFDGTAWVPGTVAGTPGPQGEKGEPGAIGPMGPVGPAGPQGVKGDTGATGASGGRTLLSGAVDPSVGDGSDGDFWLNTVTSMMFGPKVSGAWAAGWSIKGNPGDTGAPGAKGDQGLKGDTGAAGAAGPQGPAGSGAFQVDAGTGAATYTGGAVGVGTAAPAATAKLDITSTTQGFLPPRMTQAQREAIPSPAEGLMVYQTDGPKGIYVFDGSAWRSLQEPRSVTFSYNGTGKDHRGTFYGTDGSAQAWTVPAGVTSVTIECWGAQGGGNPTNGGRGGYAKGTLAVTPGQAFQIWVGGQSGMLKSGGFSGGFSGTLDISLKGYGFPGGGKSTVQLNGQSIITAGGGGGAALNLFMDSYLNTDTWIPGGSGGGPEGSGFFAMTNAAGGDGGGEPPYSPGRANLYTGRGGPGYLNPTLTNASMASGMRTGHGQVVITY